MWWGFLTLPLTSKEMGALLKMFLESLVDCSPFPQLALLVGKRLLYTSFYCTFYYWWDLTLLFLYHFVCQSTSAVEDLASRKLEVESTEEDLSMKVCDDQPSQDTGDNFKFGQCDGNSDFQCWKPFYTSNPELNGVCLLSDIVEGIVAGDIQVSTPLLMNIYQLIQQDYTNSQVEIAKKMQFLKLLKQVMVR